MREDLRNDETLNSHSHPRDFRKSLGCETDEVEAALVKLQPRRSSIDRDRLLFLAGKAAGAKDGAETTSQGFSQIPGMSRKRRWLWPLTTLASVAAMIVFGVLLGIERNRPQRTRTIVQRVPVPGVPLPTPSAGIPLRKAPLTKSHAPPVAAPLDARSSDSLAAESRLMRSRHPALMTDPDHLPDSAPSSGRTSDRLTVGDTRRVLANGLSATRKPDSSPIPSLPSILNQFRFGGGGL